MNLRRGFLRLWVVLSAAWILAAGLVSYFIWADLQRPIVVKVENFEAQFPANTSKETAKVALTTLLKDKIHSKTPELDAAEITERFEPRYTERFYFQAFFAIFGPPLCFFLFGWLVSWIAVGFSANPSPK